MIENQNLIIALSDIEEYLTSHARVHLVIGAIDRISDYLLKRNGGELDTSYTVYENDDGEIVSNLNEFIQAEIEFFRRLFEFENIVNNYILGTNKIKVKAMRKRAWRLIIRYFYEVFYNGKGQPIKTKIFKPADNSLKTFADWFIIRLQELITAVEIKQDRYLCDDWTFNDRLESAMYALDEMNDVGIAKVKYSDLDKFIN